MIFIKNYILGKSVLSLILRPGLSKTLLFLSFSLFSLNTKSESSNENYLMVKSFYNFAHIPRYYKYPHYRRWGNEYFYHYKNNVSGDLLLTHGHKRIKYQCGFSFESFSFDSDTAIGMVVCANSLIEEQKFTKYGNGNYFCFYNGTEIFPFKNFNFTSFNTGVVLGYSNNAGNYDDVISGCYAPSQSLKVVKNDRNLFVAMSVGLSGYIPIFKKFDLVTGVRYQFRLNKILHADFGFGLGLRFKM